MVKASNNPGQGRYVLPNELAGGLCLDWLGVTHPAPAVIDVPEEVIEDAADATFSNGGPFGSGLAYGSELWQSTPADTVDARRIANLENVAGVFVYDTWVRQHDSRQARVRPMQGYPDSYEWFPVDQGHSFGNPSWSPDSLSAQLDPALASAPVPFEKHLCRPFVLRLRAFSQVDALAITDQIPHAWLDASGREALAGYLCGRASKAAGLIENHMRA